GVSRAFGNNDGGILMARLQRIRVGSAVKRERVLRDICQKGIEDPARIWDKLASRGIDTTPGVIHQTINELNKSHSEYCFAKSSNGVNGLTLSDLKAISSIAQRAGGVRPLARILRALQKVLR